MKSIVQVTIGLGIILTSITTAAPVMGQVQVLQNSQMQNWIWVNDTSWQRFVFSDSFILTDVGYDNRSANLFTLSVYKNGNRYQDVSFQYNATGQWAFTSLGSGALSVEAGDILDIVGAGQNQYVGVQSAIASQVSGVESAGFWFNPSNYYQFSGAGSIQRYAFANIKVQKGPSSAVPEPYSIWSMFILVLMTGVVLIRRRQLMTERFDFHQS